MKEGYKSGFMRTLQYIQTEQSVNKLKEIKKEINKKMMLMEEKYADYRSGK